MRVQFELEALGEYRDAVAYSRQRFGLGEQFVQAVESSLEKIVSDPERHQEVGHGVRIFRMQRFPYYLFYHFLPDRSLIVVYAVAHHHRKPGYWRARLPGEQDAAP